MTQLPYEEALERARTELESALSLILQEIAAYPTPISGCDAQYIRLISDRTRIASSLRDLDDRPFVATPRKLEPEAA
ncbi:hypothetical protein [Parasphingopyxis sp.]|uniref:hypothetical protein n=1 Tax=Parasphingopyxis sp. TaxID=1920299 RepID=UPI00261E274D|nr:hypothetical protein [Parasphingopyxis sp.]